MDDGLPFPKLDAGLPSPKMDAGLPSPKTGYDDFLGLFSDNDQLPSPQVPHSPLEDSSLGVIKGNQPPVLKPDHASPTGAFSQTHDFDNDSGLPLGDDPLSSKGAQSKPLPPPSADFLGLFGDSPAAPVAPAAPAAPVAPEKPVLSADSVPPTPPVQPLPLRQAVGQPVITGGQVTEAEEAEEEGEELVFDLNTIKNNSIEAVPAVAVTTEKKVLKTSPKVKKLLIGGGILLGILLLGFVAVMVVLSHEAEVTDDQLAVIPEADPVVINWNSIQSDRLLAYQVFFTNSLKKLQQDDLDDQLKSDIRGRTLIAMTLASARHFDQIQSELEVLDNSADEILSKDVCSTSWCALGLYGWGLLRDKKALVSKYESKIGESEKQLKNVVETVVKFRKLRSEHSSMREVREEAMKMLKNIDEESLTWPVVAWVAGTSYRELGEFDKAIDSMKKLKNDDDISFSSAAAVLNAELQIILDRGDKARLLCETVSKNQQSSPEDIAKAENLLLLEYVSSAEDRDVIVRVEEELTKGLESPEKIELILNACTHANRSEVCKKPFEIVFSDNPGNMALRQGYIQLLIERVGYSTLIRPDVKTAPVVLHTAIELLDEGLKLEPENKVLWLYKAIASYAIKDVEEFNKAVTEYEHDEKIVWTGAFLRDLMNYQSGELDMVPAVRSNLKSYISQVKNPTDSLVLAIALNYIGNREDADKIVNDFLKYHPEDTYFVNLALDFALERKEKEQGEKYLQMLEARHALMPKQEFDYARFCYDVGDFQTAMEKMIVLNEKTSQFPEPAYLTFLGELFFYEGRCSDAIPYFTNSLNISGGSDPETHYYYGRCLYENGKFDAALTEFNEAANQDEKNRIYVLWVGQAYAGLNHTGEALRAFSDVIEEYTLRSAAEKAVYNKQTIAEAYFFRAELSKYQNRRNETDEDYRMAIKFMPEEIRYYKGYSIFLYENELLKKCVDMINTVEHISKDELDPIFYFVRGLANIKLNKRSNAIADLERAKNGGYAELPESGIVGIREPCEIYERLGYLYREAGAREQARNALKKYLSLSTVITPSVRRDIQADIDKI
ncbi:MAG: hypothetical protein IJU23_03275 [Proteobacteria bacterium]|nr:hypothetical protein [Pseudomonadota bacterium]